MFSYGKTSPCVNKIIKNKIKKVFFSINDPDKRSFNKSSIKFKKNKILVKKNIIKNEVNNFYKSYLKFKGDHLPFVTAKMAVSKDFFTNNKKKKWITNIFSRSRVHLLRGKHDCILTSARTIIKDNPRFTCRICGLEKNSPPLIVLDKNLMIPLSSKIIISARKNQTIIFFNKINEKKIKILKKLKVKIIRVPLSKDGDFNLKTILKKIKFLGFSRIFLESGLNLTTSFLKMSLIDDFKLFISSNKIGKN